MSNIQPPPTYDLPIEINQVTKEANFSPNWLKWFIDLAQIIDEAGGTSIDHNALTGLQGGTVDEYYHLTEAEHTAIGTLGALGANRIIYSDAAAAIATEAGFEYDQTTNTATIPILSVTGNTTLGDASGDALTINAGTWTYGSNWTATRAAGALAAGTTNLTSLLTTWSGDAGGTSVPNGARFVSTGSGSNPVTAARTLFYATDWAGTATLTTLLSAEGLISITNTGNVTSGRVFGASFLLSNTGTITTGDGFFIGAPTFSSTGSITTLNGYRCGNIGNATRITNAIGFDQANFTISGTLTAGFRSAQNTGSGAWGFLHTGTANNAFNGNVRIGSTTAPTVALDVTGAALISTTLGVTGLTSVGALTATSTVTLSGTAANIALGSNFISNGGTDAGMSLDGSNNATFSGSITSSALTSGRLPLISTAGLILDDAIFTYTNTSATRKIYLTGSASSDLLYEGYNSHASGRAGLNLSTAGSGIAYLFLTSSTGNVDIRWLTGSTEWHAGIGSGTTRFVIGTDTPAVADKFAITTTGSVILNAKGSALATNATDGFTYVPSCAGTPTGVPTAVTGTVPIVVDSTNNKLYFYSGGAWQDAGP